MHDASELSLESKDLQLVYNLVKQAPVAMTLLKGPSFIIEVVNDQALELWGKRYEDVINLPALKAFPELGLHGFEAILNDVYTKGQPFVAREMPVTLNRNGITETTYIDFTYEPLKTPGGEIEGIIGIGTDVTEQVSARKKIEESERQSFQFLAQMAAAIAVFKGEELQIVVANANCLEIFGKKEEDVVGRPLLLVSPELRNSHVHNHLLRVLLTGERFSQTEIPVEFIREGILYHGYFDMVFTPWKDDHEKIKGVIMMGTEVTSAVKTRKRIAENEEQLRIALDGGDLGYYDFYPQTGQLTWSDRTKEIFGLLPDAQVDYPTFLSYVHPEDREQANQAVQEAMRPENGGRYESEYRAISASDGKVKWLRTKGKVTFDDKGHATRFIGVIQDVTEQKISEETTNQSVERFRGTFENAAVGIAHVGLDGSWLLVNDRLCQIIGYSMQELLNTTFQNITHPEDLETDLELMYQLQEGKINTYSMQKRYIRKDNSIIWINLTVSIVRDQEGKPKYFISVIQDINDHKQAEEDLKRSEEQLRTLANSIQNLAWMADGEGCIYWFNQRWFDYTGTTLEEMQGYGWKKVLHPDHIERVLSFIKEAWEKAEPWELTILLRQNDGEYRWFLTRANPVKNAEGKVYRWIGTSTDIDDQKTVEEKLENLVTARTKELERSNEDLQQFAHVASHDLKEPVRKIRTYGSRLQKDFNSLLPDQGKIYLEKMVNAAERIYHMIDDILLYSSLNATEEPNQEVNLNDIVQTVQSDLEMMILEKEAIVQIDKLPVIEGSETLIYQLFYNLINNSLKFSKKHVSPVITISSKEEKIKGHDAREYAYITLQDNGIGFEQSEAEKIFKTFTRLNSKDKFEGTGLGLSLCQKIVERHGGTIRAYGQEGKGATFVFSLPIKQS